MRKVFCSLSLMLKDVEGVEGLAEVTLTGYDVTFPPPPQPSQVW